MTGRKVLRVAGLLACLAALSVLSTLPALAAIAEPTDTPTVSNIKVNQWLIEEGDILIYGDYNIPQTSPPIIGADEAYVFMLLDGTTLLGSGTPFTKMDNGYNKGVFSFYFAADNDLTWGQAYTIRISQNPSQFETPDTWDYVLAESSYTSEDTQEGNQVQLTTNIIAAAQRLESFHTDYTFLDATSGGTVLSAPTGETYFRGAIYGIQAMAPDLFLVQTMEIYTSRDWTKEQFDTYEERFSEGWVGTSENATGEQFGVTPSSVMGILFIVPLSVGAIIVSSIRFRRADPGLITASLFVLMGGLMGWVAAAIFASIYQAMAIYLAYVWFYARG